jgi:hypothetical protein
MPPVMTGTLVSQAPGYLAILQRTTPGAGWGTGGWREIIGHRGRGDDYVRLRVRARRKITLPASLPVASRRR